MRRKAFTLIEMMVTLAIISLLLAMLVPAIQKVREAANKLLCASNLRQIGLATQSYHGDHKKLPPGYYGPLAVTGPVNPSRGPYLGTLYCILPYLEQNALWAAFRELQQTGGPIPGDTQLILRLDKQQTSWWTNPVNASLATSPVKIFQCPSYEQEPAPSVVASHYVGSSANSLILGTFAPTNYVGVIGTEGPQSVSLKMYEGVLGNRTSLNFGLITAKDGTSNTLLIGESLGGNYPDRKTNVAWASSPPNKTAAGLGILGESFSFDQFSSMHVGGSQFVMCDGSIRFLRAQGTKPTESNWVQLQRLAGWKDGQISNFGE